MDCENMKVAKLEAIVRERGLRGYSRLRKAELIALIRNNPPPPAPRSRHPRPTGPPRPPPLETAERGEASGVSPPPPLSVRFRSDRPRQPSQQEYIRTTGDK